MSARTPDPRLLERIVAAPDLAAVLTVFGEALAGDGGLDGYMVSLVDADGEALVCELVHLPDAVRHMEETYRGGKFPFATPDANVRVFQEGRPLRLDAGNIGEHPGATQLRFERWGVHTALIHPLTGRAGPFGTVTAFTCGRPMSEATAAALDDLIRLFAPPIARALAHAALQRREQEVVAAEAASRGIFRFLERVSNLRSVSAVLEQAAREFLDHLEFDLVSMLLLEDGALRLRHAAVKEPKYAYAADALRALLEKDPYPMEPSAGACVVALLQNSPLFFPDVQAVLGYSMSLRDRAALDAYRTPRTFVILPVRALDQAIGVISLGTLGEVYPRLDARKDLLTRLAVFTGSAIANARTYEAVEQRDREIEALNQSLQEKVDELRVLAYRDSLTGLHNFAAFRNELDRRMSEYARGGEDTLSLVIVDVDHFKRFNDTHGHLAGNDVLRQVAERIQEVARRMDLPCRYGGEEFVVILPKCTLGGAQLFAERLRQHIAEEPFRFAQGQAGVTVSVGATCFAPGETMESFLKRADAALYQAKGAGRNRVVVAPPG